MKHCVALAREKRVDVDAGFCRQLFEAPPFEFVSNEYFALLVWQFIKREFQLIEKHVADVERFRPGVGRWQQIFDLQHLAVFVLYASVAEGIWLLLAEKV